MPELLVYLFKANLALVLFYLGYRVLLRKLTFYHLNRMYLLFAWVFSLSYPLIDVGAWLARRPEVPVGEFRIVFDWQEAPVETFNWWFVIAGVFWLGVVWFGCRLAIRLGSLWHLHRGSRPATWRLFRFRQVFGRVAPFSFWRNIYLNPHLHEEEELGEIFRHEAVHIDGLHTVDVLLAEACSVFCWFNPGAWLMRHAVHENLEFITDRRVLQSGVDRQTYQYSLLRVGQLAQGQSSVGNGFNFKSLKRRIMMMNKRKSSTLHLGKYLLAVPVIAVFVLVFTVSRAYEYDKGDLPSEQLDRGIVGVTADTATTEPLILVDGEAFEGALSDLDAETIERIDVLKGKAATDAYGDRGKNGVVLVTSKKGLKKSTARKPAPLFILDGKTISEAEGHALDPSKIQSISVLKDKAATSIYGSQGANGAVTITTKPEKEVTAPRDTIQRDTTQKRSWTIEIRKDEK